MRGACRAARELLPGHPSGARSSETTKSSEGALARRAAAGARRAARAALRGPGARRGLRDAARRGPLPLLGAHDVPDPRGESGSPRAARPAPAPDHTRSPSCSRRAPNELWSWDITKLLGPAKWTYFYLYVILDVFSRYVVGWMVAHEESAALGGEADRGDVPAPGHRARPAHAARRSRELDDVASRSRCSSPTWASPRRHSRPHVSNDNPFSESAVQDAQVPARASPSASGSIEHARAHCGPFFDWYNNEHHHGGSASDAARRPLRPRRSASSRRELASSSEAYFAHPERFVRGTPVPPALPSAVSINAPTNASEQRSPQRAGERIADVVANSGRAQEESRAQAAESAERSAQPTLDASEHGARSLEVRDARAASLATMVSRESALCVGVEKEVTAH